MVDNPLTKDNSEGHITAAGNIFEWRGIHKTTSGVRPHMRADGGFTGYHPVITIASCTA